VGAALQEFFVTQPELIEIEIETFRSSIISNKQFLFQNLFMRSTLYFPIVSGKIDIDLQKN
jgi:hypothetical protein